MIPPSFSFGPVTIHLYGLIIACAIYVGLSLAKRRATKYKIPKEIFDDPVLVIPLILALIGARLYHVIDYWEYYQNNLNLIFSISSGGLGIIGALIGVVIGLYIVAKKKKINLLSLLDLAAPSIVLGQAIGRIGNFVNQEGFGGPTNKIWGIYVAPPKRPAEFIDATHFHPTFFYEAILNGVVFFLLLYSAKKKKRKPGAIFAMYLIFYSLVRFFVEMYRIDTWTVGTVKVAQVVSVAIFGLGIVLFRNSKIVK